MRLVIVPRDTPSAWARSATGARASWRSLAIRRWSRSSMLPFWHPMLSIRQLNGLIDTLMPFRADAGLARMERTAPCADCTGMERSMTTLLTTRDLALIVAAHGLPKLLGRMVDYLEADFLRWQDFDKSARTAAHSDVGVIELMPVADAREYSFKYVNGHPGNIKHGLATVMAFGALADVDTGLPTVLSELTITTAIRTAATSVMAA